MPEREQLNLERYQRQMVFEPFGTAGQRALRSAKALIVGLGGLGSWTAELLARAGVGTLRLVDFDRVSLTNIHRQAMYDTSDAGQLRLKVEAAARHIERINASVRIDPIAVKMDHTNLETFAQGMDLILDGSDNFATRFIINDYSIKTGLPWIFAGVVGAQAQTMTIIPSRNVCLRCVLESPPPPCSDPACRIAGVLGPAVSAVASVQAMEAIKVLAGQQQAASRYLLKMDLWDNTVQRIDTVASAADNDCLCCKQRHFEYLEP